MKRSISNSMEISTCTSAKFLDTTIDCELNHHTDLDCNNLNKIFFYSNKNGDKFATFKHNEFYKKSPN